MTLPTTPRATIRERLSREVGRIDKDAPLRLALVYPSPYGVAMSSLGYQCIYSVVQKTPGWCAERLFLPDSWADSSEDREIPVSYEANRRLADFSIVAFSVAYEMEIRGVIRLLRAGGLPPLARDRGPGHPLVVAGGPLTFSNPWPLLPFADLLILGEAEQIVADLLQRFADASSRTSLLAELAQHENIAVSTMPNGNKVAIAQADDSWLPARSTIVTPLTELSSMFLIEVARGCSRGCNYCVMRRSTNGGMRIIPSDRILDLVPSTAQRVGLVGAAVSDHPQIVEVIRTLADRGCQVSLSSLRPDKLKAPLVHALAAAGHRTLTTALDGASRRLRSQIDRRAKPDDFLRAAELARTAGMERLKLYLMLGLPSETSDDVEECIQLVTEISKILPVVLGISPFCAKRNTPLDGAPFAGVRAVQGHLRQLRKGLQGRAQVRATSARWAWVEYVLAQGGPREGHAVLEATLAGGDFASFRSAFAALGHDPDRRDSSAAPAPGTTVALRIRPPAAN